MNRWPSRSGRHTAALLVLLGLAGAVNGCSDDAPDPEIREQAAPAADPLPPELEAFVIDLAATVHELEAPRRDLEAPVRGVAAPRRDLAAAVEPLE